MRRIRNQDGQVLVLLMAGMFIVLLGVAGLVIDVGQAYVVKRKLQGTADAAAVAGANALPAADSAVNTATSYGITGKNPVRVGGTLSSEASTTWCLRSESFCFGNTPGTQVASSAGNQANGIQVKETAQVPTSFLRLFGINSWTIRAQATACGVCGAQPLNIVVVVDRTGSMAPNIADLKAGLNTFARSLTPSLDWVSLLVLPPAPTGDDCTPANSNAFPRTSTSSYPASGDNAYAVVHWSHDYLTAGGALNTSSRFNQQVSCIAANGATAYKQALMAAKAELDSPPAGRESYQRVIVFESDGAANIAPDSWYGTTAHTQTVNGGSQKLYAPAAGHSDDILRPCGSAVDYANSLKAQGIVVMTVGYQLGNDVDCYQAPHYSGVGYKTDLESMSSFDALAGMASPHDAFTASNASSMSSVFAGIASRLVGAKLVPDTDAG